jgi:glyoxalase family protein
MAGDPQRNLNFYSHVLGQRLVKTTVNFDDPGTYHLYYGDAVGSPGTILTFFPWPNARRGQRGAGEANAVAYNIPAEALGYWEKRLAEFGVSAASRQVRFGETVLPFQDPDGLWLELVAVDEPPAIDHWDEGPAPAAAALRGFHSTTLFVANLGASARLLTELFGWERIGVEGKRARFIAPAGAAGRIVDLVESPQPEWGRLGAGSVHHIAFRVANDQDQLAWRSRLTAEGFGVTDVRDRQYFCSIYFREPSGVLYELATDPPGFLLDESRAELGRTLKLPPWLEPRRAEIQQHLPPITRPGEIEAGETQI